MNEKFLLLCISLYNISTIIILKHNADKTFQIQGHFIYAILTHRSFNSFLLTINIGVKMKHKNSIVSAFLLVGMVFFLNFSLYGQTTVVKGKLLDLNGNPSKYAEVGISSSAGMNGKDFVKCDDKGNYSIELKKRGGNFLMYSIPGHSAQIVPLINDKNKDVIIDVTLAPYEYKDKFDDIGVEGSFNNFDIYKPEEMTKDSDGTYSYVVKTDKKQILYQISGIEKSGRIINAPDSKSYIADSTGDYYSVMSVTDGKATITFDPSKLLIKKAEPKVVFPDDKSDMEIYDLYTEYNKMSIDVGNKMRALMEEKKNIQDFHYDSGKFLNDLSQKISLEHNSLVKDFMKLVYCGFVMFRPLKYDTAEAKNYFRTLSPDNLVWDLLPNAFISSFTLVPKDQREKNLDRFLNESKNESLKLMIIGYKLSLAKYTNNLNETEKLTALLQKDYPDSKTAQQLIKIYSAKTKIKVGAKIPDFNVMSLDNKNVRYSKESLMGHIYMIDFWATWCMPCVGELNGLTKAYNDFKGRGFELLSMSLDGKVDDVVKFRKDKWKMPWMNAFVGPFGSNKLLDNFEVVGIPKPILVGKDGTILAMEGELRGANLEKTLAKYFK